MSRCLTVGLLAMAALAAGCAPLMLGSTAAVPPGQAVAVPSERVLLPEQAGEAVLTVVRDTGDLGSACYFALYVNRQLAARMDVGERVSFKLPPGEVLLGVSRDPTGRFLCGRDLDDMRVQRETLLKPGDHKHFRLVMQSNGSLDIMRSDF